MWRAWLQQLDERWPRLSRHLGGRLDIELPALLLSLAVHTMLLVALGLAGYRAGAEVRSEIQGGVIDPALGGADLATLPFQDLDQPVDPPSPTPAAGSFAPDVAAVTVMPAASVATAADGPRHGR